MKKGHKHNAKKSLLPAHGKFHRFPKYKSLQKHPKRTRRYS